MESNFSRFRDTDFEDICCFLAPFRHTWLPFRSRQKFQGIRFFQNASSASGRQKRAKLPQGPLLTKMPNHNLQGASFLEGNKLFVCKFVEKDLEPIFCIYQLFPTCQVRVVRFYVSLDLLFLLLLLLLRLRLLLLRRLVLRRCVVSVPRRTATAIL